MRSRGVERAIHHAEESIWCAGRTSDLELSPAVMHVAKLSRADLPGSRSHPKTRPTKRRISRSMRTTGDGVNGRFWPSPARTHRALFRRANAADRRSRRRGAALRQETRELAAAKV